VLMWPPHLGKSLSLVSYQRKDLAKLLISRENKKSCRLRVTKALCFQ